MNVPHVVDSDTGEVLEYNSPLLLSLPASSVASIIRSLVAQEESLNRDLKNLIDFADEQQDKLHAAEFKIESLDKMLDKAHDRMEDLQEELNLSADNFYKVTSDTYSDFYQTEHENAMLSQELAEARAQIKSLESLVKIEQEMNNYLSDEVDELTTELARVEHYVYSGSYTYDSEWNVIEESEIPPSAFIIDEEGYSDEFLPVFDEDREVEFHA